MSDEMIEILMECLLWKRQGCLSERATHNKLNTNKRHKEEITIGARGLGFNSRAGKNRHGVVNGSPPLRCLFGAMLPRCYVAEMEHDTRYTRRHNVASILSLIFLSQLINTNRHYQPDSPIGAGGLRFNFRAGQIKLEVGSSPLRCFCVAQALTRGDGPRYSFHASA